MDRSMRVFIIVALSVAAIALPSLVQADGTHTGVHIFDPDGTSADLQAQVTDGRLNVQERPDVRSGVAYRTTIADSTGTTTPTVTGMFAPTQTLAISSLTYSNIGSADATASLIAWQPSSGFSCTGTSGTSRGTVVVVKVKGGSVISIPFPYPYIAPALTPAANWCLRHHVTGSGASISVTIVGFRP